MDFTIQRIGFEPTTFGYTTQLSINYISTYKNTYLKLDRALMKEWKDTPLGGGFL